MFNGVLGTIKGVKMKADKRDLVFDLRRGPPPWFRNQIFHNACWRIW